MRPESPFRYLHVLATRGRRPNREWLTPRALDLLDLLEGSGQPETLVERILEYSVADIQATRTLLVDRILDEEDWTQRRQGFYDVLAAAYVWKQVPDVIAAQEREVQKAAGGIRANTELRFGWRGPRQYRFVLIVAARTQMPVARRLQSLLEMRAEDCKQALQRFKQNPTSATPYTVAGAHNHIQAALSRSLLTTATLLHAEHSQEPVHSQKSECSR